MKSLTIALSTLFLIFSVSAQNNSVILTGKITNPSSDTLLIKNHSKIQVSKPSGEFYTKFELEKTKYFYIKFGDSRSMIILEPGDSLYLTANDSDFTHSLHYFGTSADKNNFMAKYYAVEANVGPMNYYGNYAKLNEKEFLHFEDSVFAKRHKLFDQVPNLDSAFKWRYENSFKINKAQILSDYVHMHRSLTNNYDFQLSENYPDPFAEVDLNNPKLLSLLGYTHLVYSYCQSEYKKNTKKESSGIDEYYYNLIKIQSKKIENQEILDAVARHTMRYCINKLNNPKKVTSLYYKIVKNEEYLNEIREKEKQLLKIAKGKKSPDFQFQGTDGKLYSLKDFKGKYVYIDIWSTWCKPCIKEIPDLEKTIKTFENQPITFVSICKSSDKDKWLEAIAKHKLSGVQLFAEDENAEFFTEYMNTGVPRYILLDKQGSIISHSTFAPSESALKELLSSVLEK